MKCKATQTSCIKDNIHYRCVCTDETTKLFDLSTKNIPT